MPHCIFAAKFVEVGVEFLRIHVKIIVEKSAQIGGAVRGVSNNLYAIAGGDHHALFDPGISAEISANIGQTRFRDGQTFAYLDRSAVVIHANELESHEAANL